MASRGKMSYRLLSLSAWLFGSLLFSAEAAEQQPHARSGLPGKFNNTNGPDVQSESMSTLLLTSAEFARVPAPNATGTANSTSIPATGSGLAYASACYSAKVSWIEGTTWITHTTTSIMNQTSSSFGFTTHTSLAPGATPFTLCDGYPRLNGTTEFQELTSTILIPFSTVATVSDRAYNNASIPTCSIQSSDCAALNSSYYSLYNPYSTWFHSYISAVNDEKSFTEPAPPSPTNPFPPICGKPTRGPLYMTLAPAECAQATASITLLYWPVTTTSGCDLCSLVDCPTRTIPPLLDGRPNTVVTLGTTLTSPTVYFAFEGNWDYVTNGETVTNQTAFIIPQSPTAVSSFCYTAAGEQGPPQVMNYANLAGTVPADVYRCQKKCWETTYAYTTHYINNGTTTGYAYAQTDPLIKNGCSTIYDDYNPILSIPAALRSLSPAVAAFDGALTCQFSFVPGGFLYDPPIALARASQAAIATLPMPNSAVATTGSPTPTPRPGNSAKGVSSQPTALAEQLSSPSISGPEQTIHNIGDIIASVLGFGNGPSSGSAHQDSLGKTAASGAIVSGVSPTTADDDQNGIFSFSPETFSHSGQSDLAGLVDGQIVTPGSEITISGVVISMARSGSAYLVDGHTLTPGGVVTVSGEIVSMPASTSGVFVIQSDSKMEHPSSFGTSLTSTTTSTKIGAAGARNQVLIPTIVLSVTLLSTYLL